MGEALDTELGRLLAALPSDTYVIVLGDNGTPKLATDAPFDPNHAKKTMYEGGINVPLFVRGPDVVPGWCEGLVQSTDVYGTVLDLFGLAAPHPADSVSLAPYLADPSRTSLRPHVISQSYPPLRSLEAARDEIHKLIPRRRHGRALRPATGPLGTGRPAARDAADSRSGPGLR